MTLPKERMVGLWANVFMVLNPWGRLLADIRKVQRRWR